MDFDLSKSDSDPDVISITLAFPFRFTKVRFGCLFSTSPSGEVYYWCISLFH